MSTWTRLDCSCLASKGVGVFVIEAEGFLCEEGHKQGQSILDETREYELGEGRDG